MKGTEKPTKKHDHTIKSRYLIGLGLIAIMSFVGFMTLHTAIQAESESAHIINISGKQRMLSQRTALYASEYANAADEKLAQSMKLQIIESIKMLRNRHRELINGLEENDNFKASYTINQIYFGESIALDARIHEYINDLETLLTLQRNEISHTHPLLRSIISQSNELLPDLDQVVKQYQWELEKKLLDMEILDFFVFSAIVSLLIIEVFVIFIPMERSIVRGRQDLIEQKERAEYSERIKSQFLANMSHEIRTPMNGIVGIADLMRRTELNERQKTHLNVIISSADALMDIINDILDFSKIESGKMKFEHIAFDLRTSLEEVVQLMGTKAGEKGLELILHYPQHISHRYISDPGRIRQVANNLISNAIKFTEGGHVLVSVEIIEDTDSDHINIHVEDTGIGIPSDKLTNIFEEFVQADGSTTRKYGGTGLGLAISRRIAESLGGSISVTSTENEGSTFTLSLSLKHAEPLKIFDKEEDNDNRLNGLRVLVVDDNEINRHVLHETLTVTWKILCDTAGSGSEALKMLKSAANEGVDYDIALIDYLMDGMDGLELGNAIKSDQSIAHTQLILLSSAAQKGSAKTFHEAGYAGFLIKPAHSGLLFNVMLDVIDTNDTLKSDLVTRHSVAERRNQLNQRKITMNNHAPTILLAEDNSTNRFVVEMMLENRSCNLIQATNGAEAVEMYREHMQAVDLILMDISMPEMNGFEATAKIREIQQETNNHAPIIALTAHALKEDRQKCLDAGMDDYVSKPFNEEQFERILTTYLSSKAA